MKKTNQKGFSTVETALVLVIVAIIAFVAWYVFHTKSNTDTSYGNTATTDTVLPKAAKSKTATAATIVATKTDSKLGKYLADANGWALYTYGSDTSGVSNCSGTCLTNWPIYKATVTTGLPTNVTVITRSDGTSQYAYKGMPLYTFSSDSVGKVTGDGVSNFSVAKP